MPRLLRIFQWLSDLFQNGISRKAKILLALIVLFFVFGAGYTGYRINYYFEHNPKACMLCHVHDEANKAWEQSVHSVINCHSCHHSSKKEQISQLVKFAFLGQKTVSPRHGEVIVAWKICIQCHWERNQEYPEAPIVNNSRYHARHVFMEQIECSQCHGYVTHQFLPEERFCSRCHSDRDVHGIGMERLACINCHTDRTEDLKPGRRKCLFCHSDDESIRKMLIDDGTLDVKYFMPSEETIKKAIKINVPDDAPMQFRCYECHKPHSQVRPDYGTCIGCHSDQLDVGKHETHIKGMGMKCVDCHRPHSWRVTEPQAKEICVNCHEYKDPLKFIR